MQIDPVDFELLKNDTENSESISSIPQSFFAEGMHRLCKNPLAVIGGSILVFVLLLAVLGPVFCPYRYTDIITVNGERDITARYLTPFTYSEAETAAMANGQKIAPHIFGTDLICRDYFIRVVYGTRVSLMIGIVS